MIVTLAIFMLVFPPHWPALITPALNTPFKIREFLELQSVGNLCSKGSKVKGARERL